MNGIGEDALVMVLMIVSCIGDSGIGDGIGLRWIAPLGFHIKSIIG